MDSFAPVQNVYQQLDAQVGHLTDQYAQHMACKKGCSACCISGFRIRFAEALVLFSQLSQLPQAEWDALLAKATTLIKSETVQACLLLDDDGACTAYTARPSLCRAFGVLVKRGDDVATCELNFTDLPNAKGTLSVLDVNPFYEALEEFSAQYWKALRASDSTLAESPPHLSIPQWLLWWNKTQLAQ